MGMTALGSADKSDPTGITSKSWGATPSLKSPSHVSNAPSEAAPVAVAIGMTTQTEAGTGALYSLRLNAVEGTFPRSA